LNDEYLDALSQAKYDANERDALTTLLRRNASERGRISDFTRLGQYSARLGNVDEAKESLLTAAKLDGGKSTGPQLALADFYASVGDKKTQTRRLRMAYFIAPANPEVVKKLMALGETYMLPEYLPAKMSPTAPKK